MLEHLICVSFHENLPFYCSRFAMLQVAAARKAAAVAAATGRQRLGRGAGRLPAPSGAPGTKWASPRTFVQQSQMWNPGSCHLQLAAPRFREAPLWFEATTASNVQTASSLDGKQPEVRRKIAHASTYGVNSRCSTRAPHRQGSWRRLFV